jgi:glycosyltransferase involved in cell wall biosynthesis
MDVAVNASDPEPFGIVLLEAMALGVPVVAVSSGGPAEIVEHGESGLLVPSAEPEHFAATLAELVASPRRRQELAEGGRARFEARFTTERMVEDLTAALERVERDIPARATAA